MPAEETMNSDRRWYLKLVVKGIFSFVFLLVVLFLVAGRVTYWQGWAFSGVTLVIVVISCLLFRDKTDLAKERVKPGPGTKWWDRIFWVFYAPLFLVTFLLACLDRGRYAWSRELSIPVYILGYLLYLISNFLYLWAMWTNRWFSSTVRIQMDRDQQVVRDGPYRFVRHPGYVGGILLAISLSLVLGSLWALIPAGFVVLLLVLRTYLEDSTLQKELPGYAEYVRQVRYRLLPGIW